MAAKKFGENFKPSIWLSDQFAEIAVGVLPSIRDGLRHNPRSSEANASIVGVLPSIRDYNLYEPFAHTPQAGDCSRSLQFMQHIFGEHYALAWIT